MTFGRRLAIGTRGYRGNFIENNYINETFTLQEIFETVDIFNAYPIVELEEIDINVASVQEIGVSVELQSDTITVTDDSIITSVDSCE
mgnify:FL=1|jgi:hypothetical protein|tara:strand:+ start:1103 stop:1366 length:264 start_codon:yes stop_codon:yes gene_type:complete